MRQSSSLLRRCVWGLVLPALMTSSAWADPAGVIAAGTAKKGERKMGPPPPGYVKILGETVPGWSWDDTRRTARSPLDWQPLGPRPITDEYWSGSDLASGRVVSIAPHPTDADIIYIASASGGVWKTVDSGVTWQALTDELPNLNHGCVALDKQAPDTVYVGTGEYQTNSGGDGVFKSTDGGSSWARVATVAQVGSNCSKMVVNPSNSQIVHWGGTGGYVRSVDGGSTWTRILTGNVSDLAVDPAAPQNVYVARQSTGIFKSTDSGASFTQLTTDLPTAGIGRILIAIAPSSPSTVYAAILSGNSLQGLYRSTNGGANWTRKANTPNFPSPQGSYDCFIGVSPSNPDTVYAGGVFPSYAVAGVIKTTNGGDSWTDVTVGTLGGQLHPDQHVVAFDADGRVWVGNDGGVWYSADSGLSWVNTNDTLSVTQNYAIALHPSDPNQVMGGTQDNGTVARDLGTEDWPQILSGDGGYLAYDFNSPTRRYVTYVGLDTYRLDGATITDITGPWSGDSRNFIAPLVMDPNNATTLLGGTNRVWRTTDAHAGATWTALSSNFPGTINALAVAQGASNTIYAGNSQGDVFVSTDAVNWPNRSVGLPTAGISDIQIDPSDSGRAYIGYFSTSGGRVWRTTDFGVTWQNLTGTLPAGVSAKAIEIDWRPATDVIYVGTGSGLYWSKDEGATWSRDGADLPNVNIGDLLLDEVSNFLYAGTYGRGVFRATIENGLIFSDGFESGNTGTWQ